VKKLVGVVVAAFVVFYLFTDPKHSADVVRGAVGLLGQGFDAIVTFLNALFG
jgi:hypothetical protein